MRTSTTKVNACCPVGFGCIRAGWPAAETTPAPSASAPLPRPPSRRRSRSQNLQASPWPFLLTTFVPLPEGRFSRFVKPGGAPAHAYKDSMPGGKKDTRHSIAGRVSLGRSVATRQSYRDQYSRLGTGVQACGDTGCVQALFVRSAASPPPLHRGHGLGERGTEAAVCFAHSCLTTHTPLWGEK